MEPEKEPSSSAENSSEPRGLLYILLSAFAFFCGWSSAKLSAPDQEVSKLIHPQDTPAPESRQGKIGPSVISQISPTPSRQNQSNGRKEDAPLWEKAAAITIAAGTLGLFVINILLWCATNKAATAAKDSVELAQKNARMDQRAWVTVSDISSDFRQDEDWTVRLIFKNTGKTPAKSFVIRGTGEPVQKGNKPRLEEGILPGRGVIAPDGLFHSNLGVSGRFDWKSIDLVIHGRIDYDSVFGGSHWTKFCYYFVPAKTGKGGFAPCDSGNDIDNNAP